MFSGSSSIELHEGKADLSRRAVYYTLRGLSFREYLEIKFEVGGKGKTFRQLQGAENGYVVADQIEIGHGNKIPLYLFGFLY